MVWLVRAVFAGAAVLAGAPPTYASDPGPTPYEGLHYGLLRGRDLTPFGFLRLDMRPAYSASLPTGQWVVETNLGYQNTWALSRSVEDYLTSLRGRRRLGPAEFQAMRELPGEAYLVDFELGLLDIAIHRRFDPHWSLFAGAGIVGFGGGFLDGVIENFHQAFGFDDYGRPAVRRNDAGFLFDLDGVQAQRQGVPRRGGLLDPIVGVRYAWNERPAPWNLVLEAAMKVPVGGRREFLSNGHVDVGIQTTLQHVSGRHGAYAGASAVYTRASLAGVTLGKELVPALVLGYEYAWSRHTTLLGQVSASRSAVDRRVTRLASLLDPKYQYALGVRHRVGRAVITVAITENAFNVNNTPDFGFQIGWGWIP